MAGVRESVAVGAPFLHPMVTRVGDVLMTDWRAFWWQGSLAEEGEQRKGPARRARKDWVLHFVNFEACTKHFPDEKIR